MTTKTNHRYYTWGMPPASGREVVVKGSIIKKTYEICRPLVVGESVAMQRRDLVHGSSTLHTIDKIGDIAGDRSHRPSDRITWTTGMY
jgi:hypothetical protein